MKKSIQHSVAAAEPAGVDLGRWLGRREAFGVIAGRCSAAEAESLRRIRDDKLYKQVESSWDGFCSQRLGVSRRQIDRTLRLLDEFGPAYFHVAQMAHVTAEEYRAIAPHVSDGGVQVDGSVIALIPEKREQVAAAVAELLKRERPARTRGKPGADTVLKRCEAAADLLCGFDDQLDISQKLALGSVVVRMRRAAAALGVQVIGIA